MEALCEKQIAFISHAHFLFQSFFMASIFPPMLHMHFSLNTTLIRRQTGVKKWNLQTQQFFFFWILGIIGQWSMYFNISLKKKSVKFGSWFFSDEHSNDTSYLINHELSRRNNCSSLTQFQNTVVYHKVILLYFKG
jgi:hypothetical protein